MSSIETSRAVSSAKLLTAAAHAAFVPVGIVTVLLGPMLPTLSARWSLDYAQAGSLFAAQYAASTLAVVLSGFFVSRWGFRFAINSGLLVMAAALVALPHGSRSLGWICIAAWGGGLGLVVPAANLLVAEVNPQRRSAALSLLNFSWSLGAVACPFLVAVAIRHHAIVFFFNVVAGLILLVLVGIAALPAYVTDPAAATRAGKAPDQAIPWRDRFMPALGALFFVYVGTENAVGGWIASYAKSLSATPVTLSAMTPSFFYFALMAGRWLAPVLLRTIDEIKFARAGILLACGAMAGLVGTRTMSGVVLSAALAGLGLAAVYPITISLLSRQFGTAASRVGSVMFVMANLGGACLPWLVGYSSTRLGTLKAGLMVPLAGGVSMLALYFAPWKPALSEQNE